MEDIWAIRLSLLFVCFAGQDCPSLKTWTINILDSCPNCGAFYGFDLKEDGYDCILDAADTLGVPEGDLFERMKLLDVQNRLYDILTDPESEPGEEAEKFGEHFFVFFVRKKA